MFIIRVVLLCFIVPFFTEAQNMVYNPGFECIASCPSNHSQIFKAFFWTRPSLGTSDLFNRCDDCFNPPGSSCADVPDNFLGNQEPRSGDGYCGFYAIEGTAGCNYREYIQVELSQPMEPGQCYQVSFHLSLADDATIATDEIGAYFSDTAVNVTSGAGCPLPFIPPINSGSGNWITNTTGWVQVTDTFTASGDEQYMVIGKFDPINDFTNMPPPGTPWAYYYVDDVCVTSCGTSCSDLFQTTHDTTVCIDSLADTLNLTSSLSGDGWFWNTGDTMQEIQLITDKDTSVSVIVSNDTTCISQRETFDIKAINCDTEKVEEPLIFFIANAVSPNQDGVNDELVLHIGGVAGLKFLLYDRWGQQVYFQEVQFTSFEDVTISIPLAEEQEGVYTFLAILNMPDTAVKVKSGNVTLIR